MDMTNQHSGPGMARRLAPEDITPGQYVTIHRQTGQFLWMACDDTFAGPRAQVMEVSFIPGQAGRPMKVKQVCLPYVLVKTARRNLRTLDTRLVQLVELSPVYGKAVWKASKPARSKPATPGGASIP